MQKQLAPSGAQTSSKAPGTDVVQFSFKGDRKIRTVMIEGEPWFVLSDVAKILGYRDAANAKRNLWPEHKGTHSVSTSGGHQKMSTVNESGLYRLIMRSDKDEARDFQRWLTEDVLPSIRKNGAYLSPVITQVQRARLQEKLAYADLKATITNCSDYGTEETSTSKVFIEAQDAFHIAVTGKRARELKKTRDIVSWTGKSGPTQADRENAKNYLSKEELAKYEYLTDVVLSKVKLLVKLRDGDGLSQAEFLDVIQKSVSVINDAFLGGE